MIIERSTTGLCALELSSELGEGTREDARWASELPCRHRGDPGSDLERPTHPPGALTL